MADAMTELGLRLFVQGETTAAVGEAIVLDQDKPHLLAMKAANFLRAGCCMVQIILDKSQESKIVHLADAIRKLLGVLALYDEKFDVDVIENVIFIDLEKED